MSKYTTEVRFICESSAGLRDSKGFNDIEDILTQSAPKVFNFNFPIFDENYRLPLERKILRHYYTREIGEETVALWKLRLNSRLNEIMPYYNKLYESELLTFNPFYDTDYTKTGNREREDTGSENKETTNDTTNRMTGTVADQGSNSMTDAMTGTVTDQGSNSLTDKMTGTVSDQGTKTSVNAMTGTISDNSEDDYTRTDNLTQHSTNGGSDRESGSNVNKNDHWDYYSDTPQGSVGRLDNLTYLTNARHITDDGTGSTTDKTTTYGKTNNTTNTGTQKNEGTSENVKTYDTQNDITEGDTNTKTYNTTDTKTGTDSNTKTYNTLDTKNGTDANTKTYNTTNTIDNDGTEQTNKSLNSLEDYAEHVVGKMSGISYSRMLQEFRDTFLNIDMMIINDLSDLFFGLWE